MDYHAIQARGVNKLNCTPRLSDRKQATYDPDKHVKVRLDQVNEEGIEIDTLRVKVCSASFIIPNRPSSFVTHRRDTESRQR